MGFLHRTTLALMEHFNVSFAQEKHPFADLNRRLESQDDPRVSKVPHHLNLFIFHGCELIFAVEKNHFGKSVGLGAAPSEGLLLARHVVVAQIGTVKFLLLFITIIIVVGILLLGLGDVDRARDIDTH